MQTMTTKSLRFLLCMTVLNLLPALVMGQTATDLAALKGLAPVSTLSKTPEGNRALAANYAVTEGIQTGTLPQPDLLPFTSQEQQALRDAYITGGNLAQLADGLGTTLGSAYLARAHYSDPGHFSNVSPALASLISSTLKLSGGNAGSGKYFFANGTTDGKKAVSAEALKILADIGGITDIFGKSYNLPAGSPNADTYGNSRPFQTEAKTLSYLGLDYFNVQTGNDVYNRGPVMNLADSPSFPSGHTTYGYTGALMLAILVPERYQQMIARGAEYGNDRIIVGAHYTMDVLGGRTLALYDMAHMLANDPAYVNQDYLSAIRSARAALASSLGEICGIPLAQAAREDTGRFSDEAANKAFYDSTQTYGLGTVYPENVGKIEDVAKLAPEAGYLLTAAFPSLSLEQANQILTETEGPGGGFLDNGSSFGLYSRLNLYAAAGLAARMAK